MNRRELDKYLRKALLRPVEPESPAGRFRHFIAMPVMDELEELPGTLASLRAALPPEVGVLLVVNHSPDTAPERKAHDLELLKQLRQGVYPGVFWIDGASPGKELHKGVGEARRIGMDTALACLPPDDLENAIIVGLDADSPVSRDYWTLISGWFRDHPNHGALSIRVRHRQGRTPEEETAIRKYEHFMQDYVDRLKAAGSPYAFFTIGSAMAVRASTYAACGGMRVRSGGEDFYFMQAAAKVTQMGSLDEPVVYPAPRPSDRVPFGTGPAVRSLLAGEELEVYSEEAFAALKALLELVNDDLRLPEWRSKLAPGTAAWLENRGFFRIWPGVVKNTPQLPGALPRAFHQWFDALKTLQFLRTILPGTGKEA